MKTIEAFYMEKYGVCPSIEKEIPLHSYSEMILFANKWSELKESESTSRHKIGDDVLVDLFVCGKLSNGKISGIKYTDYGKVLYDITLNPFSNEEQNKDLKTILKDVDSYFIKAFYDDLITSALEGN